VFADMCRQVAVALSTEWAELDHASRGVPRGHLLRTPRVSGCKCVKRHSCKDLELHQDINVCMQDGICGCFCLLLLRPPSAEAVFCDSGSLAPSIVVANVKSRDRRSVKSRCFTIKV
jgi:hypothetical protein